jgi:large subunit ribosomal protein L3
MKALIGKKIGMTRIFSESGESVPVSVIEAGPCSVLEKRTMEKDGYEALQLGFGSRPKKLFSKPQLGHFEKAGVEPARHVKEVRGVSDANIGDEIKVDIFQKGERVDITGISRGLGFQGVMRRHGFAGAQTTHGQSDRWRAPGSIGQSSNPSRVFKGMRMAGKTGKDKVTVLNLEIMQVIDSENLLLVKGAVPGKKGTLLKIRQSNRSR